MSLQAEKIIDLFDKIMDPSPVQPAGLGGSALGRKTTKVLRSLIDHYSGMPMDVRSVDVLSDAVSSQRTPLRFPSVLSKFQSPVEASPDAEDRKSLARRIADKQDKPKTNQPLIPRYKAAMDWVDPNVNSLSKDIGITIEDYIPSKTIVHAGCVGRETGIVRKVLESVNDQENVDSVTTSDCQTSCTGSRPVQKRLALNYPETASQPTKKAKKSQLKPKVAKNKVLLQKGQKQLTSFFRM